MMKVVVWVAMPPNPSVHPPFSSSSLLFPAMGRKLSQYTNKLLLLLNHFSPIRLCDPIPGILQARTQTKADLKSREGRKSQQHCFSFFWICHFNYYYFFILIWVLLLFENKRGFKVMSHPLLFSRWIKWSQERQCPFSSQPASRSGLASSSQSPGARTFILSG